MSAWLSKLLLAALKYLWPLILEEFKDWVADQAAEHKDKREKAKAKEAYDKVAKDPASTPKAKADANKDLINS